MEKKVIDLMDCNEETTIYLPKNYEKLIATKDDSGMIDTIILTPKEPNTLDLVPKSWEEFCGDFSLQKEFWKRAKNEIEFYLLCAPVQYNVTDTEAFIALIQLRALWYEWVKVLGKPDYHDSNGVAYITFSVTEKKIVICECFCGENQVFAFRKKEHAEKFIECFKELLDKAKILI